MFLLRNLEEILASIAISITVLVVIVNVVLRYGFGFVVPWSEELSVICFIWAVYLGISSCYKHKLHMGVDVIVAMLPTRPKRIFKLGVSVFLLGINILMSVLSYQYLMLSSKVTPVMGMSYFAINGVLLLSFSLMAIHTVKFIVDDVASLKSSNQ
ncbi:TRAP transporter small permease [Vibrio fortis]|uniref:TRAP transporter small permease protein n=1 Tax=Vibrio fortis TaxID=212667 RepID=A0A5N3SAX9_9VIBR|nr:TRAP transporter small permease [Vibrio fortis]KAB0304004.1 TRAP transporter small permease [Vibrio fortis]